MHLANRHQTLLYYAIAFVNGAVLMGVEILGSRILAPHFGNTIFVWGSLIGLFMAGMSLGYYLGGWLGDRGPVRGALALLLLIPGVLLLLFPEAALAFCGWLADQELGPRLGPFLAATVLFLLPSICMGAVSPCIFVLLFRSHSTPGRSVGSLYAVSTLGSIVGTLGTAFYLILWAGTRTSLRMLGVVMLVLAMTAFLSGRPFRAPKEITTQEPSR